MIQSRGERARQFLDGDSAYYIAAVLYRGCLDFAYLDFVTVRAWQAGFALDIQPAWYAGSWLAYVVAITLIRRSNGKPSHYFIAAFYFIFYAPATAFFGLSAAPPMAFGLITAAVAALPLVAGNKDLTIPSISSRYFNGVWIAALLTLTTVVWLVVNGGLRYFSFDFEDIYADRETTSDLFYRGPFAYLTVWTPKIFVSLILCHALLTRRFALAAVAVGVELCLFAITKHRAVLIYPALLIFIYLHGRYFRSINLLPMSLTAMIACSLLVLEITGHLDLPSLLIRRALFVPVKDAFDYMWFFSMNAPVYWSNSILSSWVTYPYDVPPQRLIADFRGSTGWVNNGFIANGYMHAGIVGIAAYTILCGIVLRLLDSVCRDSIPAWFATAVTAPAFFSLLFSSDLLTALLTHGVGLSIAFLALYSPPAQRTSNK